MLDAKGLRMNSLHLKKGYNLSVAGAPSRVVEILPNPSRVALLPEHLAFIKPRLKVKIGDSISVGTPLIEDKRNTDIQFMSPGGGKVSEINFGPRRVIQSIVIKLHEKEAVREFERFTTPDIEKMDRSELIQALIKGGLWQLIRELPFRDYVDIDTVPPAIYVCMSNLEPFCPSPDVYLADMESMFKFGLAVCRRLSQNRVHVCVSQNDTATLKRFKPHITLNYSGNYPIHDPGVLVYHTKSSADANRAWYIYGQDLLLMAHLLNTGRYPTERTVVVAGSASVEPRYFRTRIGAPLAQLTGGGPSGNNVRFIEGGLLTGYTGSADSYLGFFESALNLIPLGDHKGELLGLFRPGYRKPSYSRIFLSSLNRSALEMDCNIHGGDRACIACGYCAQVCPVDILPQFAYKAVLAGEVEEALAHGLLDCVDCGLCTYVCPSKLELMESFKRAKMDFCTEQAKK